MNKIKTLNNLVKTQIKQEIENYKTNLKVKMNYQQLKKITLDITHNQMYTKI